MTWNIPSGSLQRPLMLSRAWCNRNEVMSSFLEAISLLTPALERFSVRAVAQAIRHEGNEEVESACREFIREESRHTRAHSRFNADLKRYLGVDPPGLHWTERLFATLGDRLSLSRKLLLAAAIEHVAAVLSKDYLILESGWEFEDKDARRLFAQHASEELDHRCVVFDLCLHVEGQRPRGRWISMITIVGVGIVYVALAVPWIVRRKFGGRSMHSWRALARFLVEHRLQIRGNATKLWAFVRDDYHPIELDGAVQ